MEPEREQPQEPADPVGDDLGANIRANTSLLNALRYDYGQRVLHAQENDGEMPNAFELAALTKLEGQVANDRLFAEARELTRRKKEAS